MNEKKEKKVDSLSRIIKNLEKNKIVSNHAAEILDHNFSGLTLELLKSELKNRARKQMKTTMEKTAHFYNFSVMVLG